ncbi:MAG: FtsX-like permease family protein [Paludibacteraceae bacterium]|nr:FtsX-like permease family protein [Paludibacteraceae bacterium]
MSLAHFIAKRIHFNPASKKGKNVSKPAVRIATIGIALGLAVMLVSIAVVTGFKNEISRKVFGFGSHIQITALTNNQTYELPPITVTDSLLNSLRTVPNITYAEKYGIKPAIIKTNNQFQGVVLKGVDSHYNWDFFANSLMDGTLPSITDSTLSNEVIISETLARSLELTVGQKLLTYFIQNNIRVRQFTISGIYRTGLIEFDKSFIIGDIKHIQQLNQWSKNQVSGIELKVANLQALEETGYNVYQQTAYTLSDPYNNPYYTRTAMELQPQIFSWLALLDTNIVVILTLMMIVSGFTMTAGLLILILEKSQLIGTLKALGADNWTIRKIFLYQSAFLIGKGMVWGNVMALLLCFIQHQWGIIPLDPTIYFVDTVPVELSFTTWLLLNIGVAAITLCMMLLPSHIIAKISPAKAIKFD